jgi:hypothetical protein
MNDALAPAVTVKHLRPLKWNELVRLGDFVRNSQQGFELWDGPRGFRADAFVNQIYRRLKSRAGRVVKTT